MTDAEVKAALASQHYAALWLTLFGEARGEPVEGQIAVASVIRNRVGRRFGATFSAVCLAPKQFSCWNEGTDLNHRRLMDMARRELGDFHERAAAPDDPRLRQIKFLAQGILNGDLEDNTSGADHYLTKALFQSTPPTWAIGQTAKFIARHAFLTLG